MQIATRQFADTTVARPAGRIDHRSAADFEAALAPLLAHAAQSRAALVLDFADVEYISSVGLRVLMIAAKQMRAAEAALTVAALQDVVAEIFTISRFEKILTVCPGVEQALALGSPDALQAWRAARAPGGGTSRP